MREEKELAGAVDVALLPAPRVPGVADLDPRRLLDDVVITRRADDGAAFEFAHHERQHMTRLFASERLRDVALGLIRSRHRREPELPELAVRRRRGERLAVLGRERLQTYTVRLQGDALRLSHIEQYRPLRAHGQGKDPPGDRPGVPRHGGRDG